MNDSIKIKGWIEYKIYGVDGKVRDEGTVYNTITNAGLAQLALLAGDASATPFTYLALGSGTTAPAASQTALVTESTTNGFARVAATVSRVTTTQTNDTLQLTTTFTASGSATIEEIGIFNASSSGTMLSRALTGSKSFVSGETYTTTYKVKFS